MTIVKSHKRNGRIVRSHARKVTKKLDPTGFRAWIKDGNVVKMKDGYATQDAQYRNRLKGIAALRKYFIKEFRS